MTANHLSCYFHFTQAVYRAIQRFGLSGSYGNDENVKRLCRKLMALPMLPEPVIEDTYDECVQSLSSSLKQTVDRLLQYFQEQWFSKVPPIHWCVHELVMRTNNNAEGMNYAVHLRFSLFLFSAFHSRFNRRVQFHHPDIWSFIKFLQAEENRFYRMFVQFNAELGARTKQPKTLSMQKRSDNLDK